MHAIRGREQLVEPLLQGTGQRLLKQPGYPLAFPRHDSPDHVLHETVARCHNAPVGQVLQRLLQNMQWQGCQPGCAQRPLFQLDFGFTITVAVVE